MIAARHDPFGVGLSRRRLATGVAIAAIVIVGLATSLGTALRTSSAVLGTCFGKRRDSPA